MAQTNAPQVDQTAPWPRFRGLKRFALANLLLAAALAGLYGYWAYEAQRRFDREIASLRARGAPVSGDDLRLPVAADDEHNAAYYYRRAAGALKLRSGMSPPEVKAENLQVLADVRRARQFDVTDWGFRYHGLDSPIVQLVTIANLSRVIRAVGGYEHDAGDDLGAAGRARDLMHLALAVQQCPYEHHQMLGRLIADDAVELAWVIATRAPGAEKDTVELRSEFRDLIQQLGNERAFQSSLQTAVQVRRLLAFDAAGRWENASAHWLAPAVRLDAVRYSQYLTQEELHMEDPDHLPWPDALPPNVEPPADHLFVFTGSGKAAARVWFHPDPARSLRLARIALALRLYAMDHDGAFPDHLDALVPDYLPVIPADPRSRDHRSIGYMGPPAAQPVLFTADGARYEFANPSAFRARPTTRPSAEAQQDQVYVPDDPRDPQRAVGNGQEQQ